FSVDGAAIAIASRLHLGEFTAVFGRAVRLDVVRHDNGTVGDVEDRLRAIQRDAVCANILIHAVCLSAPIDEIRSAGSEIGAVPGDNEIINAAERLTVEIVRQDLALRGEYRHFRGL